MCTQVLWWSRDLIQLQNVYCCACYRVASNDYIKRRDILIDISIRKILSGFWSDYKEHKHTSAWQPAGQNEHLDLLHSLELYVSKHEPSLSIWYVHKTSPVSTQRTQQQGMLLYRHELRTFKSCQVAQMFEVVSWRLLIHSFFYTRRFDFGVRLKLLKISRI